MTPYLLDTNIASYIIKGTSPPVRRRLNQVAMAQLSISAVTEGELRYGVARRPDAAGLRKVVEQFFLRVRIHPWDSEAAQQYGAIRAALEKAGRPMGNLDIMIAAHAVALGAVLVTNDHAFRRIETLRIEDWTKA
jgi:tRNA(fMet)-specific endonuclease VapC